MTTPPASEALAQVHRAEWGRLLSLLVARTRRLDLAEDALGEAFLRASQRWPADGLPGNPAGWLHTTAYRIVLGSLRAEAMRGRKAPLLTVGDGWAPPVDDSAIDDVAGLGDDRLALILLCCHPALHPEARSPLALRLAVGTRTDEIARLFLVPRPTMAARITRAKKKIITAGIPLSVPAGDALRSRLDDVCRTVYLAFTAGYAPGKGPDLLRADLAGEAVELAGVLVRLVPEAPQIRALRALLLLQHARRDARVADGELVRLADQDRSLWNVAEIHEGLALVSTVTSGQRYTEELRLQGLIAAEHASAATASQTDWQAIAQRYAELEEVTRSAVVRLNRAVAVAESRGPNAGLALLAEVETMLWENHRLHAVKGELSRRAGDTDAARACYRRALELCTNEAEHAHLSGELAALG